MPSKPKNQKVRKTGQSGAGDTGLSGGNNHHPNETPRHLPASSEQYIPIGGYDYYGDYGPGSMGHDIGDFSCQSWGPGLSPNEGDEDGHSQSWTSYGHQNGYPYGYEGVQITGAMTAMSPYSGTTTPTDVSQLQCPGTQATVDEALVPEQGGSAAPEYSTGVSGPTIDQDPSFSAFRMNAQGDDGYFDTADYDLDGSQSASASGRIGESESEREKRQEKDKNRLGEGQDEQRNVGKGGKSTGSQKKTSKGKSKQRPRPADPLPSVAPSAWPEGHPLGEYEHYLYPGHANTDVLGEDTGGAESSFGHHEYGTAWFEGEEYGTG
ncbi:hypothetical protein OQA88_30 [Cercophora sp. LCS_1]